MFVTLNTVLCTVCVGGRVTHTCKRCLNENNGFSSQPLYGRMTITDIFQKHPLVVAPSLLTFSLGLAEVPSPLSGLCGIIILYWEITVCSLQAVVRLTSLKKILLWYRVAPSLLPLNRRGSLEGKVWWVWSQMKEIRGRIGWHVCVASCVEKQKRRIPHYHMSQRRGTSSIQGIVSCLDAGFLWKADWLEARFYRLGSLWNYWVAADEMVNWKAKIKKKIQKSRTGGLIKVNL